MSEPTFVQQINICRYCKHGENFHFAPSVVNMNRGVDEGKTLCFMEKCFCIVPTFIPQIQICIPRLGYIHKITKMDAEDLWKFECDEKIADTATIHRNFDVVEFFRPNGGPDFRKGTIVDGKYKVWGIVRNTPTRGGKTSTYLLMHPLSYSERKPRTMEGSESGSVCDLLRINGMIIRG